jgi:hypothetical protein
MTPRLARWLFRGAAIYGLIVLLPLYFLERQVAAPAELLDHPIYYYGFVGAAAAWQLVYWTIGNDPVRYRAFMPLAAVAKFGFWVPSLILWLNGRAPTSTFAVTNGDLILGIAFFLAWRTLKTSA